MVLLSAGWLVYGDGCLMQRQYKVKMSGMFQTGSLVQVELLLRWLIQQVQLYVVFAGGWIVARDCMPSGI